LEIDQAILREATTRFCPGVANANGMVTHSVPEAVLGGISSCSAKCPRCGRCRSASPFLITAKQGGC
jgi:hypothetical protein